MKKNKIKRPVGPARFCQCIVLSYYIFFNAFYPQMYPIYKCLFIINPTKYQQYPEILFIYVVVNALPCNFERKMMKNLFIFLVFLLIVFA